MVKCITHKRVYPTVAVAEDALVESWINFDYAPNTGPIAIYRCDDCGYYHFTSKGVMNDALAKSIASGKVKLQKQANTWQAKFKKRN